MKTLPIILFLTVLLLSACKKEKNLPDPPIQYMPQELKDYMLFKKNSYWVYQDSATGVLDSVVVTADSTYIYTSIDPDDNIVFGRFEGYDLTTFSHYSNRGFSYLAGSRCMFYGFSSQDFCYLVSREVIGGGPASELGKTICFFYYPIVNASGSSYGGWVKVGAKYDSLQVLGKYYPTVVRMDDTANGTEHGWPTRFYFSKNHGIIRKEINYATGRKVWNLVRHQLIQ